MAIAASFHISYDLHNFEGILGPVMEEASNRASDQLKATVSRYIRDDQAEAFIRHWQLPMAAGTKGTVLTIGELADSYRNEVTAQVVLPSSIKSILVGRDGLIYKAGGGNCPYLLQDIQIGYIKDITSGSDEPIGPIIISGRNRLVAIQAFLKIACPTISLRDIQIRCLAYTFTTRASLEDAIIAANSGRDFPRSENREKKAARNGVIMSDKDAIRASLPPLKVQPPFAPIVGAWLKLTAAEQQLNTMTAAQISDGGASLANMLAKDLKPEGMTLGAWFKADTRRLITLCEQLEPHLERAITDAVADPASGALSRKLAVRLLPVALQALRV